MFRWIGALILAVSCTTASELVVRADEKSDLAAKQKETALANLMKLDFKTSASAATGDILVVGTVTEKEAKSLADLFQKQYTLVTKALKFDAQDKQIQGKMTIYCFTTKREYATFARLIRKERPEANETSTHDVSGDDCFVALVVESSANSLIDPEIASTLGVALLERKTGIDILPAWVKIGFRKAVAMRIDPKFATTTRTAVKALMTNKSKSEMVKITDTWQGESPDKLILAATLMDYMAFGSDSTKLISFLSGYKPSEDVPTPGVMQALMAASLKEADLEKNWRNYVIKGK